MYVLKVNSGLNFTFKKSLCIFDYVYFSNFLLLYATLSL